MPPPWNLRDRLQMRLAKRAAAGDRAAFRALYLRLFPLVDGYVHRRIRSEADAQDLTARVFHRVLEHLPRYDAGRGTVRTWVLTLARNVVIDHMRSLRPGASLDDVALLADASFLPDAGLIRDEQTLLIRGLLCAYSSEVRDMLALRFGDGLRYREIAQLLGSTEAAVKQRFSRILRELREQAEQLEKRGATPYVT